MSFVSQRWALVALAAACLTTAAMAEEVMLTPKLDVGIEWSDNLQKEPSDRDGARGAQSGWVLRLEPSIDAKMPVGDRTYFEVDYTLGFVYIDSSDLTPAQRDAQGNVTGGGDDTFDTITHDLRALARYSVSDSTSIGLSDRYRYSEVVEADGDAYELNTAKLCAKQQVGGNVLAEIAYAYQTFHDPSRDREYVNYDQHGLEGVGTYRLSTFTTTKLTVGYTLRDFDGDTWSERDYHKMYGLARFSQIMNEAITAYVEAGYHTQSYTSEIDADGEDVGLGFQAEVGEMTMVAMDVSRSTHDVFYVGERDITPVQGFSRSVNTVNAIDREYVAIETDRIALTANMRITDYDVLKVGYGWVMAEADSEYDTDSLDESATTVGEDLDEDLWYAGLGVAHRFPRWAKLSLDYAYGERDSNLLGRDYHYNSIAAQLGFVF